MKGIIVLAFLPWQPRGRVTQVRIPILHVDKTSFRSVDDFREPAKLLFNAGLARITDRKIAELAESWQRKRTPHHPLV